MKKSPLVILFLTVFIDLLGFGMVLPLLPYYAVDLHADAFQVGLLLTVYSLMQMIFSPIWGGLSDRIGRRPVLIGSLLGSSVGLVLFGLSNSLLMLFASRAFSGITAATISIAQAYIADSTTPENRTRGMALIGMAFGLGFVFGPAFGGLLAGYGHGVPAFVAAGIALANCLFAIVRLPESLPPERRGEKAVRGFSVSRLARSAHIPGMPVLMLVYFFTIFAFATMEATFPLLTRDRFGFNEMKNGYVFAYLGVLIVIVQGGMRQVVKRVGEKKLIILGTLLLAVGLGALPWPPTIPLLLVTLVPLAVGNGITNPSLTALISLTAEAGAQGETLGTAQSLASLGRLLGPLWGGFAYERLGMDASYAVAGGIMIVLTFAAFGIRPKSKADLHVETPAAQE